MELKQEYITGIQALNYHHYDWHSSYFHFKQSIYENSDELKKWLGDFGINNNIANPYRAFLDYLYNSIHFLKIVPNYRINMFLFDENESKKLLQMIENYLRPKLNKEELILLEKWKIYNNGGKYEFNNSRAIQRKIRRKQNKSLAEYGKNIKKISR